MRMVSLKFNPVRGRKPFFRQVIIYVPDVEIYPREGAETLEPQHANPQSSVEIYPREGTETSKSCSQYFLLWLKFIPVRGRKLRQRGQNLVAGVEIYPREGIETCDVKTIKSSFFPNLNDKFNPKGLYKKEKMC